MNAGSTGGQAAIAVCYPDIAHTLSARADGSPQPDKGNGANIVVTTAGFKAGQGTKARGIGWEPEKSPTLASEAGGNSVPSICVAFAQNQRNEIRDLHGIAGSLAAQPGMKQQTYIAEQYLFENHSQDTRYKGPLDVCPMLPAQLGTGGNNTPFVVETAPGVYCMATQQGGAEVMENKCPTITASAGMSGNNKPVICMAHGQANAEVLEDRSPCLNCNHEQPIVAGVDCRNGKLNGDLCGTLQAKPNGGFSYNCIHPVIIQNPSRYVVRRLTPTECARLQGFPDRWGWPDEKDDFTEEEYRFWCGVVLTKSLIDGSVVITEDGKLYTAEALKPYKPKSKQQMLRWYNKLHTDSAEYKMWGNGIALPTALYCMQGIAAALKNT